MRVGHGDIDVDQFDVDFEGSGWLRLGEARPGTCWGFWVWAATQARRASRARVAEFHHRVVELYLCNGTLTCSSGHSKLHSKKVAKNPPAREPSRSLRCVARVRGCLGREICAGNFGRKGLTVGPDRAIFEVLFLPDGHGAFERVDQPAAGVESGGAMGRGDHDQHAGLADLEAAKAVHEGDIANLELLAGPGRRELPSAAAPSVRRLRSRGRGFGRPRVWLRTTPSKTTAAPSSPRLRRARTLGRIDAVADDRRRGAAASSPLLPIRHSPAAAARLRRPISVWSQLRHTVDSPPRPARPRFLHPRTLRPIMRQHIAHGRAFRQIERVACLSSQFLQHPEEQDTYAHKKSASSQLPV